MTTRLLLASVLLALATVAAAQSPGSPADRRVVVVRGTGEVRAPADQAFVTVGAEQRARTPREAQGAAATTMAAVQQRLGGAGFGKDAIRTVDYSVQAEFDYANGKATIRGYVARNTIEIRVDDVARVSEVLDIAVNAGGTSVQGMRFDVKNRTALEREALTKATADARARADAAAAGAGGTIGAVVRIEEGGVEPERPVPMMAMRADAAAAPAPPVVAGETVIRVSVTLTAALK